MLSTLAGQICGFLLLLSASYCAVAQEEMNSAFVTVAVWDTLGGAIPNARLQVLEHSPTNEKELVTGETGNATVELRPGTFDLTVTSPGFAASMMRGVKVKPGEHRRINIVLKVKVYDCCIDFVDPVEAIEPESAKFGDLEESNTAKTAIRKPDTMTGPVDTSGDVCAKSAHLRTYSNAIFVEEAGDVVGYELVFQASNSNSGSALLYVYEGEPNDDGISVSGQISAGKIAMKGNWVQHLIEEPTKKQVVQTYPVEISGTLNSKRFRGNITISGSVESLTLKRVEYIWLCKPKAQ